MLVLKNQGGFFMKYITLIFGLLFFPTLIANAHLKAEQEVLSALEKYFDARNNEDYKTVVALESKSGTYSTNSDGSFHKPRLNTSVEQWKKANQGGVTNVFYPEAIQLSEEVVFVRFYSEGMVSVNDKASNYRTRVTMNWVKEAGDWVVKSQHYSAANYGGVHLTQPADFDD